MHIQSGVSYVREADPFNNTRVQFSNIYYVSLKKKKHLLKTNVSPSCIDKINHITNTGVTVS